MLTGEEDQRRNEDDVNEVLSLLLELGSDLRHHLHIHGDTLGAHHFKHLPLLQLLPNLPVVLALLPWLHPYGTICLVSSTMISVGNLILLLLLAPSSREQE